MYQLTGLLPGCWGAELSAFRRRRDMFEAEWDGVLGQDKWEWGLGCRGTCSANGSSGRPHLLLAVLHCNYLQWRNTYCERSEQKLQTERKTDRMEDRLSSHLQLQEYFLQSLNYQSHPLWVCDLLDYLTTGRELHVKRSNSITRTWPGFTPPTEWSLVTSETDSDRAGMPS